MSTNDVRIEIYRSFIEDGRAPMPADIAQRLDIPIEDVESGLSQLHADDVIALVAGTHLIWLAHPFSALDAPFRVRSEGRTWDAICVWDALGVLAVVDSDGEITTPCPDCGETLKLEVHDGDIAASDHVVHFGIPAARWYEDIGHT